MIERTLVLLKPDCIQRHIMGEIISRFEKVGLKVVGMKMVWCDKEQAMKHYTEDITVRRGEFVRNKLLAGIVQGPIVAICLEGIGSIEIVRKIVGNTEPKSAAPGTIRGDYAHISYSYADEANKAIPNIVHASTTKEEANNEINLWFKPEELHSYKLPHEYHIL